MASAFIRTAAALGLLAAGFGSMAAPTIRTGVDTGFPPFDPAVPNLTVNAFNSFKSLLDNSAIVDFYGTEDFENVNAPPTGEDLKLKFGDVTATLKASSGNLRTGPTGSNGERFSVPGGTDFWEVIGGATFEITFDRSVTAFSFFSTDMSDALGTLTIELLDSVGNLVGNRLSVNTGPGQPGNILFWGLLAGDAKEAFQTVRFSTTQPNDIFGFDTFTVGAQDNIVTPVPEPVSLALVGLALAGIAATRRRA